MIEVSIGLIELEIARIKRFHRSRWNDKETKAALAGLAWIVKSASEDH